MNRLVIPYCGNFYYCEVEFICDELGDFTGFAADVIGECEVAFEPGSQDKLIPYNPLGVMEE